LNGSLPAAGVVAEVLVVVAVLVAVATLDLAAAFREAVISAAEDFIRPAGESPLVVPLTFIAEA
jgi:hypothetical protein